MKHFLKERFEGGVASGCCNDDYHTQNYKDYGDRGP